MSARCKPGDIAVVISATLPENLGCFVRVVGAYDEGLLNFQADEGPIWEVESNIPMTWRQKRGGLAVIIEGKRGPVPDNRLQPITGLQYLSPRPKRHVALPDSKNLDALRERLKNEARLPPAGWLQEVLARLSPDDIEFLIDSGMISRADVPKSPDEPEDIDGPAGS